MDSIYDYLHSIVYMKTAVSKLLDAQSDKIRIFAKGNFTYPEIAQANESIKRQMNLLEGLNFIMLNKFDQIINFQGRPEISKALTPETQEETQTPSCVQTPQGMPQDIIISQTPPCVQTPQDTKISHSSCIQTPQLMPKDKTIPQALYILRCAGSGNITCQRDEYCGGLAIFQARISNDEHAKKRSYLIYSVKKNGKILVIISSPAKLKADFYIKDGFITANVNGEGTAIIKERYRPDTRHPCGFYFTVHSTCKEAGKPAIGFCLSAKHQNKIFIHESGDVNSLFSRISAETLKTPCPQF